MTNKEQIDIAKSFLLVCDTLEVEPARVGAVLKLFFDKFTVIQECAKTYNQFIDSDIVGGGEMLGIKITSTEMRESK